MFSLRIAVLHSVKHCKEAKSLLGEQNCLKVIVKGFTLVCIPSAKWDSMDIVCQRGWVKFSFSAFFLRECLTPIVVLKNRWVCLVSICYHFCYKQDKIVLTPNSSLALVYCHSYILLLFQVVH